MQSFAPPFVWAHAMISLPLALVLAATPAGPPVRYPGLDALLERVGTSFDKQLEQTEKRDATMTMHQEELDSDGKVTHVTERVLRTTHPDGKPSVELVRVTKDGKDITEDERAKAAEHKAKDAKDEAKKHGGMSIDAGNPFAADVAAKYRYWVVAPLPAPGAPVRIHFEPNGDPTEQEMTGDALVDPASGAVQELDFTPSKAPSMVDHLDIQLRFGAPSSDGPLMSAMNVDGAGHLLFWKKHMRIATRFDYAPAKP